MKLVRIRKNDGVGHRKSDVDESFFYDWIKKKTREARALDSDLARVFVDDMGPDTMRIYISTTSTWWNADDIKRNNNIDKLVKFFNDTVKECKQKFPNIKITEK